MSRQNVYLLTRGSYFCESLDGTTWTARTNSSGLSIGSSIININGVIYYFSTGSVYTTSDLVNSNLLSSFPSNYAVRSLYYNGSNLFIAGGVYNNGTTLVSAILTSPDGINWTSRTISDLGGDSSITSIVYNGSGCYLAAGAGTTQYAYSTNNGVIWTSLYLPSGYKLYNNAVAGGGGFFSISLYNSSNNTHEIGVTFDTTYYFSFTNSIPRAVYGLAYGNGTFVALAASSTPSYFLYTNPGSSSWTSRATVTNITNTTYNILSYVNNLFLCTDTSTTPYSVVSSVNGVNWTSTLGPDNSFVILGNDVVYGPVGPSPFVQITEPETVKIFRGFTHTLPITDSEAITVVYSKSKNFQSTNFVEGSIANLYKSISKAAKLTEAELSSLIKTLGKSLSYIYNTETYQLIRSASKYLNIPDSESVSLSKIIGKFDSLSDSELVALYKAHLINKTYNLTSSELATFRRSLSKITSLSDSELVSAAHTHLVQYPILLSEAENVYLVNRVGRIQLLSEPEVLTLNNMISRHIMMSSLEFASLSKSVSKIIYI